MSDLVERPDDAIREKIAREHCKRGYGVLAFPDEYIPPLLRLLDAARARITELEAERDTATRALEQLRDIVSNDPNGPALRILVLIDAALSKTEGEKR